MSILLIDNSNSRTKFALTDGKALLEWRGVLATPEVDDLRVTELLSGIDFDQVLIASVVPEKAALLERLLAKRAEVSRLSHASPLGIGIDYPRPDQIGADRLANAVGVVARHGAPAIVIDFGTAVTFDVISAEPAYCGGVIAPGLGAMTGYLTAKTALLPKIQLEEPLTAIGKTTEHALQVGAVIGYRGLVREILAALIQEMGGAPHVIATGGDAALIAKGVSEVHEVDPDITLEGLRIVAARIFLQEDRG